MLFSARSMLSDFADRQSGIQAQVGKLEGIPPQLLSKALLSDGWAIRFSPNTCSQAEIDERFARLKTSYAKHNITLERTELGAWLMFGDIEKFVAIIHSKTVDSPIADYAELIERLQNKRAAAARQQS